MAGGWSLEQWLEGFERNVEGYVQQALQTAREAAPADDPAWSELRGRYRVGKDPLLARWIAGLNPARPRGASAEELRQVLEALAAWAQGELGAFARQAPAAASHPVYQRIQGRLGRLALDEVVRYREALAASALGQPAASPSVGGIFANAAKTAGETPWAEAYKQGAQAHTLICSRCGSAQERPLDFLCRYCKQPLGLPTETPMNANQQQFMQEWQGHIQQATQRIGGLLREAEAGCRQLIAQNPDDPMPVQNALSAINVQIQEQRTRLGTSWSDLMLAKLMGSLDNRHVIAQGEHWLEQTDQWIDETWARFRAYWLAESGRAMWPRVAQLLQRGSYCVRCGAPIKPANPVKPESIHCGACNTVNQFTPDPILTTYYTVMPDRHAENAAIDKRIAIDRWRREVRLYVKRNHQSLSKVLGGSAEEPVSSLDHWESLERDYWKAYAAAQAQIKPLSDEEQARFVDGKMKHFTKQHLHSSPAWRRQKGVAEPRPASPQELLAPIEGVSIELYAQLSSKQASLAPADFQNLLAQHRLDHATFERAAQGWQERMRDDATFTVTQAYTRAFTSAPAAAPPGAPGGGAPAAPPREMSFELYCEILGAQNAWTRQGKDVNAMLKQVFNLTAAEFATASAPISMKMMTDPNLAMRMMPLMQQGEQKHSR
jgi:hypothetical protein